MKKLVVALATVICTALATSQVSAAELSDGTYVAKFGSDCAVLTVKSGTPNWYEFGPCGKAPTWTSRAYKTGNTIRIGGAVFKVTRMSKNNISGTWRYMGPATQKTFSKR